MKRALCVVLAAALVVPAWGAPADLTQSPAPIIGADPPKSREIKDGDASVSTQTGALQYGYPIAVPPGRGGAEPHLALTYSSQGAIYGGVASGWSLSVPEIRLDVSVSPIQQLTGGGWDGQHFVSTLAGGRPLVAVTEASGSGVYGTFRAQNDSSYVRYERMHEGQAFLWRARAVDGTTYYFGDTVLSDGWVQPLRVPLTRTVDTFGNTVEYQWSGTELRQIRYTSNVAAGLPAFARVEFDYVLDSCGTRLPPGAADDLRINSLDGRRRLAKIRAVGFDSSTGAVQHTREYTLGYDAQSCYVLQGVFRQLTSIQESAWGLSSPRVDLPPVTFGYNRRGRSFDRVQMETPHWVSADFLADSASSGTRSAGGWPAVHSMLLDFDADGLPDKIWLSHEVPNECAFTWQKNLGRGTGGRVQFGAPSTPQIMPRLPWATGTRQDPERCALNFQRTKVHNVPRGMIAAECGDHNMGSYLAYRWTDINGDGRIDLVAAIQHSGHLNPNLLTLNAELRVGTSQWPMCRADQQNPPLVALGADCAHAAVVVDATKALRFDQNKLATCIAQGTPTNAEQISRETTAAGEFMAWAIGDHLPPSWPPGEPPPDTAPHPGCDYTRPQMLCDRSPWLLYENQPDVPLGAKLAERGRVTYQVAQLETDSGDSSVGGSNGWQSGKHAIQDLDGDGTLDLVVRGGSPEPGFPNYWTVSPGDGGGGFDERGPQLYHWFTPDGAQPSRGGSLCFGNVMGSCRSNLTDYDDYSIVTSQMLVDLNGDGAADYVRGNGLDTAEVFYGNGYKFRVGPGNEGDPLVGVRGALARSWAKTTTPELNWLREGWRVGKTRLVDVDADGRPDLIQSWPGDLSSLIPTWSSEQLLINAGGDFLPPIAISGMPNLTRAMVQKTTAVALANGDYWATVRDLIDMDGDGLPEHWNFEAAQGGQIPTYVDTSDQPLRLLRTIDNGIGGAVEIHYAPTTKSSVVVQDASRGKAMPRALWVVDGMTRRDRWDADVSTTAYQYVYPVWNQDERGDWGFRGFEEVKTTRPSEARVVDSYGYGVDWSGRLEATRTFSTEDTAGPRTLSATQWQAFRLFGGAITTYHSIAERTWTCRNGQTEAACQAGGLVKGTSTWTAKASSVTGGTPLLYALSERTTQTSETYATGDRRTVIGHRLQADADTYRLQEEDRQSFEQTAAGAKTYDRVQTFYDAAYRAPTRQRQWLHDDWTREAEQPVTTWIVDPLTGVRRGTQAPRNYPAGPYEMYAYDRTQRFITRTTNELGQVVDRTYQAGTGAVLSVRGPTLPSCGAGCNATTTWTDVDGLGRTIATWVSRPVPGSSLWGRKRVTRNIYTDRILSGQTTEVVSETLVDYDEDRWTRERTRLDGQARPKQVLVATGLGSDAVTTYDYDHRGHVVAVTLPDPSANDQRLTVTYRYDFDSLGRTTSIRRPALVGAASGVDVTYDGLVRQYDEIAGGEGGPIGRALRVHDAFGRLVQVAEWTGALYAKTLYSYDARDIITRIDSPDGVTTELHHDFAGRRTKIIRAGRTWTYAYDRSGARIAESAPAPSLPLAAAYTTTYAYDVAGRPRSRSVGSRNLSSSDQSLFGVGTLSFEYDSCRTGQLCTVAFPSDVLGISYAYDAEGNATRETRRFNLAGVTGSRSMETVYGPGGRVREHTYADANGTAGTRSSIQYDDRALPSHLWWIPPSGTQRLVARQRRNLAGLVTTREAAPTDPAVVDVSSTFAYDRLSRVQSQTVTSRTGGQLAKQALDYFGHDDPRRLQHWLGAHYYNFDLGYDARHQLASVKEASNQFAASYQFTLGAKLARVTVAARPAPGSDVLDRDVTYQYASPIDPEAVSALAPIAGGPNLRSYAYDSAGNLVTRDGGSASESFLYDGESQLRRATVGAAREEYFYDHDGHRAAVVTRARGSVEEVRVFFGDTELVFGPTSVLKQSLAHLSLGTPVARITDRTQLELQYHGLSNNTLVSVTPDGVVQSGFVYAPYGEVLRSIGTAANSQRRRFNDKFRDRLTSLTYYGVRYYDGLSLTWTQADPMYRFTPDAAWTDPRRANLYEFSLHNPVRYVDPDGRNPLSGIIAGFFVCGPACAVAGGAVVLGGTIVGISILETHRASNDEGVPTSYDPAGDTTAMDADLASQEMERVRPSYNTGHESPTVPDRDKSGPDSSTEGTGGNNGGPDLRKAALGGAAAAAVGKAAAGAKSSLSAHKEALKRVQKEVGGSLPPGKPGKFGSPQRGTPKKGYRLDPGHPGRPKGDPEAGPHINWWDYLKGKRGSGGRSGAVPIE